MLSEGKNIDSIPSHVVSRHFDKLTPKEKSKFGCRSDSLRKIVSNVRFQLLPKLADKPKTIDEINIDEALKLAKCGSQFLQYDNGPSPSGVEDHQRIIILSTDHNLRLLENSYCNYIDGTFGVSIDVISFFLFFN